MRQAAAFFILVLVIILAFGFQGARGIWQPDEGYYVGIAVKMNDQGQYLIPKLDEEIFLDKPPLLYWGIVGGMKAFGQSEFAVRVFSGLCFALTVFLVFVMGKSFSGRFADGFWAALIYSTMVVPFIAAGFVTPDTPLTLFTTLSMLAFWRSVRPGVKCPNVWKMVLCAAVGLGFLTKGPAALIPCGAMFVYLLIGRKVVRYFLTPWAIAGVVIFVLLGLSWYVYISMKLPESAAYFFDNMVWGRLISGKYQRNPGPRGALIYAAVLLAGTLPWSVLWYARDKGLDRYFFAETWKDLLKDPVRLLLACWIVVPVAVLCIASSKLGLYVLPVFPALALGTAKLLPETALSGGTLFSRASSKRFFFVLLGAGLLLISRPILGAIPSANDCRSLWKELGPYLPKGEYEIVAVDERVDGLSFYGAMEVENNTRKTDPYPTFTPMEIVQLELEDMKKDNFPHLFLVRGVKHLREIQNILSASSWRIQQVVLKNDRYLLVCFPQPNIQ
jgi:4-amino-4-deoxy-L-arabinose transferase